MDVIQILLPQHKLLMRWEERDNVNQERDNVCRLNRRGNVSIVEQVVQSRKEHAATWTKSQK